MSFEGGYRSVHSNPIIHFQNFTTWVTKCPDSPRMFLVSVFKILYPRKPLLQCTPYLRQNPLLTWNLLLCLLPISDRSSNLSNSNFSKRRLVLPPYSHFYCCLHWLCLHYLPPGAFQDSSPPFTLNQIQAQVGIP